MGEWVVRGGVATPQSLKNGYRSHRGVPGLAGFSVQYQPGRTIEQLAAAGLLPHPQINYALDIDLVDAAQVLGYRIELISSPGRLGNLYHHTLTAWGQATGGYFQALPDDLAAALSAKFTQRPNPARVPPGP